MNALDDNSMKLDATGARMHVLGFGLLTYDCLLLLDHFPSPNEKLATAKWHEQIGGPVAVGLMTVAALGLRAHWGVPLSSQIVRLTFDALGISYLEAVEPVETPEAIILIDQPTGARTVILQEITQDRVRLFEAVRPQLPRADWIYFDGRDPEFTRLLKSWAEAQNAKLFLDMGSLRPAWQEVVANCEIVIISDDVMRQLDPALAPERMLQLLAERGVRVAGMTLGQEGSLFLHEGRFTAIPAAPVSRVVDATNAGDVFHGAFLAKWIETGSVRQSAEFASRCAAWAVGQIGHNVAGFAQSFREATSEI